MAKKLTAKETIKARCADCFEGRGDCPHTDCQLFGLRKPKGGCSRTKAIKEYCKWCRNGLPYSTCSSPSCPIYKYLDLGSKVATDDQIQVSGE
jgi:hypothetical protein